MLNNIFKSSLKINYLAALIEIIDPKIIITFIDNSNDYYYMTKLLNKKRNFLAIQNASRVPHLDNRLDDRASKSIFHQKYAHFGNYEKKLYKKFHVQDFIKIGSLRQFYAWEYFKKKKIKTNKIKYDICLVSDSAWTYDKKYGISGLEKSWAKTYEYVLKFSKKHKKKIAFVSDADYADKSRNNKIEIKKEKNFYKKHLRNIDYKLIPRLSKNFTTYKYVMQSKVVIAVITTILTEALAANKRILACNFTNIKDLDFPVKQTALKDCSYEEFEKKLKLLLNMKISSYHKLLGKNKNLLIDVGLKPKKTFFSLKNKIRECVEAN